MGRTKQIKESVWVIGRQIRQDLCQHRVPKERFDRKPNSELGTSGSLEELSTIFIEYKNDKAAQVKMIKLVL